MEWSYLNELSSMTAWGILETAKVKLQRGQLVCDCEGIAVRVHKSLTAIRSDTVRSTKIKQRLERKCILLYSPLSKFEHQTSKWKQTALQKGYISDSGLSHDWHGRDLFFEQNAGIRKWGMTVRKAKCYMRHPFSYWRDIFFTRPDSHRAKMNVMLSRHSQVL